MHCECRGLNDLAEMCGRSWNKKIGKDEQLNAQVKITKQILKLATFAFTCDKAKFKKTVTKMSKTYGKA